MLEKVKNLLFKTCPKTGKIRGVKFENKWFYYLAFPILGILATIWILVRVIPKPSRLSYPCMKVAMPFATTFLTFIGGLLISFFSLKKLRENLQSKNFKFMFTGFLALCMVAGFLMINSSTADTTYANNPTVSQPANQPMGEAKGLFPGRVVWVHNPAATNEFCNNSYMADGIQNEWDNGWFLDKNNDQEVIDEMLNTAVREITGKLEVAAAWEEIFKFYNSTHDKGVVSYQPGEKIFIKLNLTSAWGMGESWGNINDDFTIAENSWYGVSETSPHLVLSLLKHLVNVVGVAEEDIYVGDPMKHIYKHRYDLFYNAFPDIHYLDYNKNTDGREKVVSSSTAIVDYSDRGAVLRAGSETDTVFTDYLYTIFEEMDYMINVPTLKGHKRAGITAFAKNHFGSHTRGDATHLHNGLIAPNETDPYRAGYGFYRVATDMMAHEILGGKNLIYLMDALWSAGAEVHKPSKWKNAPFNDHWSSSIFISQDPVAIESVGYDFLRAEYTEEQHPDETFVQMEGTDEYLHHAADSTTWPDGIVYDPENDGTPISSQGVHEHWNNEIDREYLRNLGLDEGIELKTRDYANNTQDDTVIVQHVVDLPVFDGIDNESCWQTADWQEIGQTWIPYGDFVLSDDFQGRYKAVWNYDDNLLCFLVEIKDDTLVDGHDPANDDYFSYDVLEVFIDEDNSGGMHRIDQGNENAENAFSYHINVNFPEVDGTETEFVARDIAGFWEKPDFADHFEHFIVKRYNNKVLYEFALKVYDDSYDDNDMENSRVHLLPEKILGFSMAYCDNDDPDEDPKTRDNFFGSVEVTEEKHNSHWEDADGFGTMKLVDEAGYVAIDDENINVAGQYKLEQNYPNPFNPATTIAYSISEDVKVNLSIYNMAGQKVAELVNKNQAAGYYKVNWNAENTASGIYFYRIKAGKFTSSKRCLLIK